MEVISDQTNSEKCRLCLSSIAETDIFYYLNDDIKFHVELLTSIEIKVDDTNASSIVCFSCHLQLSRFIAFRDQLIQAQLDVQHSFDGRETKNSRLPIVAFEEEDLEKINSKERHRSSLVLDTKRSAKNLMSDGKLRLRPKAWIWSIEMEIDLIRYYEKFKNENNSNNTVFKKISRIFVIKEYPSVSQKSIKYKFEKMLQEPDQLKKLQLAASLIPFDSHVEQKPETEIVLTEQNMQSSRKNYTTWNEDMEIMLLFLLDKRKSEQPGISNNELYRSVAEEMKFQGYSSTEHAILYKLKKSNMKCNIMKQKAGMLSSRYEQEKKDQSKRTERTKASHLSLKLGRKRNYFFWNEEMKRALMNYRKVLEKKTPPGELWETIAKRMNADGYGKFTAQNVMYKYHNLKRTIT